MTRQRGKCELCHKRRMLDADNLCRDCGSLCDFIEAGIVVTQLFNLYSDPEFLARLEQQSQILVDAIRLLSE